jgi:transposase
LTAGQRHDITQAEALLPPQSFAYLIADKSYDAEPCVQTVVARGAVPVIPPRSNRNTPRDYDKYLYRERHLAECFINKIKYYRRIFSRFDKLDRCYLGFLSFVGALIWLR